MSWPLVTIGVPTHNRPNLLERALESVAAQDYPRLEVIVADNATPGDRTTAVVESFRDRIPGLVYHRHPSNTGPRANFYFLLDRARGDYFMWLADDDAISPNYVSVLADCLARDESVACALARWVVVTDTGRALRMRNAQFRSHKPLVRAANFIWRADDSFFYALHRIEILRQASFRGYWWPNEPELINWAYPYLLDTVLRGRVVLVTDGSPEFMNHQDAAKSYERPTSGFRDRSKATIRRINVHALYWGKCVSVLGLRSLLLVVPISVAALVRDGVSRSARALIRRLLR